MRALALVALLLPQPVMADQILASSKIISVTLYPEGAQVTRDITFTAPAGPHDLLIADLPSGIVPDLIRLASPDLQLGAFSLRNDRLPPRDEATNPALVAAKAGVEAATLQLATAQAAIDAINARVESAEAQAAFLKGIKAEGGNLTVEALQGIAQMVGTQTLTARQTALAAQADLPAAQKGVTQAQETLAKALAAQEALSQRDENFTALSVAFQSTAAGEAHLTLTHYVENASWRPVYDLNLTRKDTPSLTISRGVLVSQSSGEDWADVSLTLSTAQPSDQSEPSQLYAQLRSHRRP
ncbi:MAG: mucoidy inhibitor MuiA family protein [Cypionkella sp.]